MSEERKMILQMLADGKITADEADSLLQAIDESERAAEESVVESAQRTDRTGDSLQGLGRLIDQSVKEAFEALDETFRSLETRLQHDEVRQEQLKRRVEERIRRSTERALERALQAEERAKHAAERAAARMQEHAERLARRELKRADRELERADREPEQADRPPVLKKNIVKMGVHVDKVSIERTDVLETAAQPNDRLVLNNRVGDVQIEFYDGDKIEVEAHKTVWGSDEADAKERADSTAVHLVRNGSEVTVEITRPSYTMVMGYIQLKDTRIDFRIRVPRQTHLQVMTKVGNIRVEGDEEIATWFLAAKVGDIDLTVPEDADFRYTLSTVVGNVDIDLLEENASMTQSQTLPRKGQPELTGTYGDGQGSITASAKTGDIRLHH
ncbi:MAG: SHOCT-like domain-containing protein [Bacillota bacterium]